MPSLLSAALLAVSLAVTPVNFTSVALTTPDTSSTDFASGPSVVEVPLGETLEVRPAEGWRYASCDALRGASELVTACSPGSFSVTGGEYDADIEPVRVSVRLQGSGRELLVDYVIRLAEPAAPAAPDTTVGLPLPSGAVSLVPLSELGIECGLCTAGTATVEVRSISPKNLGTARVTGAHLVYSAAPNAQGLVEVDLRVRDDIKNVSKTFKVMLNISVGGATNLHGLHLAAEPGPLDLTVSDLVSSPTTSAELLISACGPALYGTVRCTPGGEIHYEPATNAPLTDQFAVRFVESDGRQTLASVTLIEDAPRLAPGAGTKRAKLKLELPTPPPEVEESTGGATTRFSELMDALGAR